MTIFHKKFKGLDKTKSIFLGHTSFKIKTQMISQVKLFEKLRV